MADSDSTPGKSPAFQFYPGDFLRDGKQAAMSLHECGAYIRLICFCWTDGSIPNNTERLARLVGTTPAAMRKLWPAIESCFRVSGTIGDRLIHPRLEREREKQDEYRRRQSDRGKASAASRRSTKGQPEVNHGSTGVQREGQPEGQPKGNSSIFSLRSSDFRQENTPHPPTDARSKRPIFQGSRFTVFEWMLDDLRKLLGAHYEAFDLHEWFFALDAKALSEGMIVPQRDGGKWLQARTLEEALRRGFFVDVAAAPRSKTAGNAAVAARFIARGGGQ